MKGRFRVVHVSELHCGSVLGVTPPQHMTQMTRAWLGPLWDRLESSAKQIGKIDALVANGDLVDGPGRKDSSHHVTTDIGTQAEWAAEALELFKVGYDKRYIVRGTGYHTDGDAAYENIVAQHLNCDAHDELRLQVWDDLWHVRHHIGRSDTPYGQHTQAQKEAINDILQSELEDYDYADLLSRGHVHYCISARKWNTSRNKWQEVFTNPAMQLRGPKQNHYVRKLRTWMYHVGFTVIDFWKGEPWEVRPIVWPIKVYAPEMREYLCLTNDQG